MKSNKIKYFIAGGTIFCALISLNALLGLKDTDEKTNIIINYNRSSISDENNEIKIISDNGNIGADFIPVPDTNEPVTLDTL